MFAPLLPVGWTPLWGVTMSLVKAENLGLRKGSKEILKDINWEIHAGENWVLFGLNGCGKTTLLSILSGYQSGNEGCSYLFDEKLDKVNFMTLRNRIGFVSSSFFDRYLKKETVSDIVLAGKFGTLGIMGDISDEDVRKAKRYLRELGIEKKMRYPYDCLSKGQQQRVLIARALMNDPEILLLDEPCSGLDIIAREVFLHSIMSLAEEKNISIIYVTHHTEEILPFFNRAALMKNGELVAQGPLQEVFRSDVLGDFFGVKTDVLWTDKHFFINLDLPIAHKGMQSFSREE